MIDSITSVVTSKLFLWALGLSLIVGGTLVVINKNRDTKLVTTGKEAGAATAVVAGQEAILNQVEAANNAEQEITRGGDAAAFDRCVRYATADSRAGCDRFRPVPNRP